MATVEGGCAVRVPSSDFWYEQFMYVRFGEGGQEGVFTLLFWVLRRMRIRNSGSRSSLGMWFSSGGVRARCFYYFGFLFRVSCGMSAGVD